MVERMLRDFDSAHGIRSAALRYFNAAGADPEGEIGEAHEPETHIIPLVLDVALGRRPEIAIFGDDYATEDGSCIRDYIHVSDLADAHVLALRRLLKGAASGHFNLGNGRGFSVRQVIEAAAKVTGKAIPAVVAPRRPGDPPRLVADAAHAKQALGWRPKRFELETQIADAWQWHQRHGGTGGSS
jgi:UDP-glucose-4-epimerase GalE